MSDSEREKPPGEPMEFARLEYARAGKRKPTGVPNIIAWPIIGLFLAALALTLLIRSQNHPYSRDVSNRVKSAINLKQIGLAMQMYANDHNHQFPDSMSTILANEDLTPDVFVNPSSNDTRADGPTTQAVLADFAKLGRCSYLYFGTGLFDTGDPTTVTACEAPVGSTPSGMNVLFLDGHVEFVDQKTAQQIRAALAVGPVAWTSVGGTTRPTSQPMTQPAPQ
jgi:prepilin-type processing-associated H-X9-DG protein